MKLRLETSCLATPHQSGVAYYTSLLLGALHRHRDISVESNYFNFLNRQPNPIVPPGVDSTANSLVPLRVYAKIQSYNLAPAFDINLPPVDVTIFPNFATWPTRSSQLSATVIHDLTYIYHPDVVEEKNLLHLRRVVPRTIKSADFIITVSEAVKSEIIREFNIDPSSCIVTTIPPDESFRIKRDVESLELVRKKYQIKTEKFIFFLGNLEPRKNLSTLVEAYCRLPENVRQSYSLVMAGARGWKTESTERVIKRAVANGENVQHIGFIDAQDRPALYQAAAVFVMPSLYEGFGMPILESLSSHTPVVASHIPVLEEAGGDVSSYADPLNPDSFSAAILETIKHPPTNFSQYETHLRQFSWQQNVENIYDKATALLEAASR